MLAALLAANVSCIVSRYLSCLMSPFPVISIISSFQQRCGNAHINTSKKVSVSIHTNNITQLTCTLLLETTTIQWCNCGNWHSFSAKAFQCSVAIKHKQQLSKLKDLGKNRALLMSFSFGEAESNYSEWTLGRPDEERQSPHNGLFVCVTARGMRRHIYHERGHVHDCSCQVLPTEVGLRNCMSKETLLLFTRSLGFSPWLERECDQALPLYALVCVFVLQK